MPLVVHRNIIAAGSMEEPAMLLSTRIFLFTPIFLFLVGLQVLIWMLRRY